MAGTLYLIPAALGDAAWTTYLSRDAREIACGLRHFVVENAKTARAELKRIDHPSPLRDLDIRQMPDPLHRADIDALLQPLTEGRDVGLLSEAGCPAIADPGALLVRRAHEAGIPVRPLVGASSLLLALMASGLDGQRFAFHGYLPQRDPERTKRIQELEQESRRHRQTQIFIETPYRNLALFEALVSVCRPATLLCLATDMSLPGETVATRSIADWRAGKSPGIERRPTVFLLLSGY
jgi:16S rRNA (cytidine1402-2'-O)-methyltransferase